MVDPEFQDIIAKRGRSVSPVTVVVSLVIFALVTIVATGLAYAFWPSSVVHSEADQPESTQEPRPYEVLPAKVQAAIPESAVDQVITQREEEMKAWLEENLQRCIEDKGAAIDAAIRDGRVPADAHTEIAKAKAEMVGHCRLLYSE